MKKILTAMVLLFSATLFAQENADQTALLIIDIQDFYFPGGGMELHEPEKAADNAALLLAHFRKNNRMVVHVRHEAKEGGAIHTSVAPMEDELVITKTEVNCFKESKLYETLMENNIKNIVICGMQTHMCMEAATRAASDFKFNCTVIEDACATRDLTYDDRVVKAADVHASTLRTLKSYATVMDTRTFLEKKD